MVYYKTMMAVASKEKVCTFFDPLEPRRCVHTLLDDFKKDKRMPYLRLGIWYLGTGSVLTGYLFVVKNRLPPSLEGAPVRQLLTETMIIASRREWLLRDRGNG